MSFTIETRNVLLKKYPLTGVEGDFVVPMAADEEGLYIYRKTLKDRYDAHAIASVWEREQQGEVFKIGVTIVPDMAVETTVSEQGSAVWQKLEADHAAKIRSLIEVNQ